MVHASSITKIWGTVLGVASLTLTLCSFEAKATLSDLTKYTVDESIAATRGAYCNDGSLPIYYYEPATDHEAGGGLAKINKWIVYLDGGHACINEDDCSKRWNNTQGLTPLQIALGVSSNTKRLMTSTLEAPTKEGHGFFSGSEAQNSQFANMHKVFIHYCSSDAWLGRRLLADPINDPVPEDGIVNMAGAAIIPAVFDDIAARADAGEFSQNIYNALRVILAGESAGGLGALGNANRMRTNLAPQGIQMRLVVGAGTPTYFGYNLADYLDADSVVEPGLTYGEEVDGEVATATLYDVSDNYDAIQALSGRFAEAWLDPACTAEHGDDADYCYSDVARMQYLDATLKSFFTMSKQDQSKVSTVDTRCLKYQFGESIRGSATAELGGVHRAYFFPESTDHMRLMFDDRVTEEFAFDEGSKSLLAALKAWMQADGDGTDVKHFQDYLPSNAVDEDECPVE